jgi:hypothetical protein
MAERYTQLNTFTAIYSDPALISCSCRRCCRGELCDWMAEQWQIYQDQRSYEQACAALTTQDVDWLRAHGWPD